MSVSPTHTNEATPTQPSAFVLVVIEGHDSTQIRLPTDRALVVGRAPEADVVLRDRRCSRFHARIAATHERPIVTDLASHNGTRVNGQAIGAEPLALALGDTIEIGNALLVLHAHIADTPDVPDRPDAPDEVMTWDVDGVTHAVADPIMIDTIRHVRRLAQTKMPVLIVGETGVGKEGIARLIHHASPRAAGPFVAFNSAAMPADLVESELFGHERGAFTGAVKAKPGLIEVADRGTLFLDEIGELTPRAQATLLRVLETGRVRRVGDVQERPVDFRVVAATHRDLDERVAAGQFRADLLFRLAGATVQIPPLRARPRDLELLVRHFLASASPAAPNATAETLAALARYPWPGNVRELKFALELALTHYDGHDGGPLLPAHLPPRVRDAATTSSPPTQPTAIPPSTQPTTRPLATELDELEARRIHEALRTTAGNRSAAARLLGMPRRTFFARLKALGITKP